MIAAFSSSFKHSFATFLPLFYKSYALIIRIHVVSFNHQGITYNGIVIKLNSKTASIITTEKQNWRVGYGSLAKVVDGEVVDDVKEIQ